MYYSKLKFASKSTILDNEDIINKKKNTEQQCDHKNTLNQKIINLN